MWSLMADTPVTRTAGLLLHPSSLPGPFGIGDLGPEAYRWVEQLAGAKQTWWQILPLGPTGYGDSPYQSYSAFAGNINLLSPELLQRAGLIGNEVLANASFSTDVVDYERVTPFKKKLVRDAWDRFDAGKGPHDWKQAFEKYCAEERDWLEGYALFMAIRDALGLKPLHEWPQDLRTRQPVALHEIHKLLKKEVLIIQFGQFLFDMQWRDLRRFASEKQVKIMGDAPIFVSGNSADVWAHPDEFLLDAEGNPKVVAGVPPDYFSDDGQLWGNPLYDWERMSANRYQWWQRRIRRQLAQVDMVRLDHFRGFAAAWHVPPDRTTAKIGEWVDGPRAALFDVLQQEFGKLPIVAEDLGLITEDVHALRKQYHMPGMRVLQFAIGGPDNPYWPHNFEQNTVAYTGTHDNDTTVGWYNGLPEKERKLMVKYLGHELHEPNWDLIRMAWSSVAEFAIAPLQDILGFDASARMNTPGTASGNWRWRYRAQQLEQQMLDRLADWTVFFNRVPTS